jgi:hypothetical protein
MEMRRDFPMLEGQDDFDQPRDSSGGLQVTEIRFDRSDDEALRCFPPFL